MVYFLDYNEDDRNFIINKFDNTNIDEKDLIEIIKNLCKVHIAKFSTDYSYMQYICNSYNNNLVTDDDFQIKPSSIKPIKCKDCGEYFILTGTKMLWYMYNKYSTPKRCNKCREKRRNNIK